MNLLIRGAPAAALLYLVACGPSSEITEPGSYGTVSATINGLAFTGTAASRAQLNNGTLSIGAGYDAAGGTARGFAITVSNVTGPGIFAFGPSETSFVLYIEGITTLREWTTLVTGATGTLEITELSATRVVGKFEFLLQPDPESGASGTKLIENGEFNIRR